MMYFRIQPSRLYEQIEQLILDGRLHAGDQLPSERELAEQLNVRRTVVREAVHNFHLALANVKQNLLIPM